ncbi:MAG: ABC transporter substrate-binding protein [Myxococcota bacterium]
MNPSELVNGGAVFSVLCLGSVGALWAGPEAPVLTPARAPARTEDHATERIDASGLSIPLVDYPRLVSMCTVSDQVLLALVPAVRIAAVTEYSRGRPDGWRYPPGGSIRGDTSLEDLLSMDADLFFVCSIGGRIDKVERAREAGLVVFDLGDMHGLATLPAQIEAIGAVVGEPERAAALRERWLGRMARVAADVPEPDRPLAMYLSVYGDQFFGGTTGSSYHDVLRTAGLVDLAAQAGFEGWPAYDAETLLSLNPSMIVTRTGGRSAICTHPLLASIEACQDGGRVVELDGAALGDPGMGMLAAAEDLRRAVHGPESRATPVEASR